MNIFVTDKDPKISAKNLDDKRVINMIRESAQMLCTALDYYDVFDKVKATSLKVKKRDNKVVLCKNKTVLLRYIPDSLTKACQPTHINHPCNVWARKTYENWTWLWNHAWALCQEYTSRYDGKHHKYENLLKQLIFFSHHLPKGELTPFVNCTRNKEKQIDYTSTKDVFLAYKLYLADRWDSDKREPTWYRAVR